MGNIHFLQILDFVVGWTGYDISGDDKATWLAKQEVVGRSRLAAAAAAPPRPSPEMAAKPSTLSAPAQEAPWWTRPKPGPPHASSESRPTLRRDPEKIDVGPLDAQP